MSNARRGPKEEARYRREVMTELYSQDVLCLQRIPRMHEFSKMLSRFTLEDEKLFYM